MQVKTQDTHHDDILDEIIDGLKQSPNRLPTTLFYDENADRPIYIVKIMD